MNTYLFGDAGCKPVWLPADLPERYRRRTMCISEGDDYFGTLVAVLSANGVAAKQDGLRAHDWAMAVLCVPELAALVLEEVRPSPEVILRVANMPQKANGVCVGITPNRRWTVCGLRYDYPPSLVMHDEVAPLVRIVRLGLNQVAMESTFPSSILWTWTYPDEEPPKAYLRTLARSVVSSAVCWSRVFRSMNQALPNDDRSTAVAQLEENVYQLLKKQWRFLVCCQ